MSKLSEIRIIAGTHRSRKLTFPDLPNLRPTPNRVRETLFNWLGHKISGANCLDAFAGSGALGFEALSRGAKHVTFVDNHPDVISCIRDNARLLKQDNVSVMQSNVLEWLASHQQTFDVVFLDPPFKEALLEDALNALVDNQRLSPDSIIYIESAQPLDSLKLPQGLDLTKHKQAGQVFYGLLAFLNSQ